MHSNYIGSNSHGKKLQYHFVLEENQVAETVELYDLLSRVKSLERDRTQHQKDLYLGNGKPGITTRLSKLEDRCDDIEEDIKSMRIAEESKQLDKRNKH